jgi:hypothetical protein
LETQAIENATCITDFDADIKDIIKEDDLALDGFKANPEA